VTRVYKLRAWAMGRPGQDQQGMGCHLAALALLHMVGTHIGNMVRHGESLVRGARQWRKQATQFALWTLKAHIMGRHPLLLFNILGNWGSARLVRGV
jgi:hypothetical protein